MSRVEGRVVGRSRFAALVRGLGYLVAFALPPVLAAGWGVVNHATAQAPPELTESAPAPPDHDPTKRTAVVVAGVTGAESIDVLVPYELLAASGHFNVYTVAPERRPLPLFPGTPTLQGTDFLPHFTLAEFDAQITTAPDVVIVPFIPASDSPANAPLLAWLRERVAPDTTLLTICGGSWVAAEAGLLDGRQATNHQNVLAHVEQQYPAVSWVDGQRWVQDGNIVSSAGITAGFDATLRVLDELLGRETAREVAGRIGYPHLGFLDDPTHGVRAVDTTARMLNLAYRWERSGLGVALYDGVGEIEVASIVDLYPRTQASTVQPIAAHHGVVTTRHGLHLVPRHHVDDSPALDRVLVPGRPPAAETAAITRWAATRGIPVDHLHQDVPDRFMIDAALHDLARQSSRASAALVATGIEYPFADDELTGGGWPFELLLRPLLLGALGLAAAHGMTRWRAARRRA